MQTESKHILMTVVRRVMKYVIGTVTWRAVFALFLVSDYEKEAAVVFT